VAGDDDLYKRLDEAADLAVRLPPDDPAVLAAIADATRALSAVGLSRPVLQDGRVAEHYERLAGRLSATHPLAVYVAFMAWAARYVQALLTGDTDRAAATLDAMIRAADAVPAGHPYRPFVLCGVASAHVERHGLTGDVRSLDLAEQSISAALEEAEGGGAFAPGTQLHGFLLHVRGHVRVLKGIDDTRREDQGREDVAAAIKDLERALELVGPDVAARVDLTSVLEAARVRYEQFSAPSRPGRPLGPATSAALRRLLSSAEAMGSDRVEHPVIAAQAAAGLALRALSSGDPAYLNQAIERLAAVCATPGLGLRERPRLLQLHGFALQTRHHLLRDPRDLSNAIGLLEQARRAVEQELGSPYASGVLLSLADAYRTRANEALGDTDRAVRIGLAGLREHAGDVLLQDSDENALRMARRGSDDATDMARWFLARGRNEAAVGAIELGRGMVLHAATSGASVAEALTEAGHPALAAAWAGRAGAPARSDLSLQGSAADDDLRYRAMRALEGTQAETALLAPPAPADVTAALAAGGADLLCYLLPQQENGGGMATGLAVLIDKDGTVRWLPLPRLRTGPGSMADDLLRARRAAESGDAGMGELRAWPETLGRACDWAWQAAIGPVLKAAPGRGKAGDPAPGPRRVVLVPLGRLGLIPWHAARHGPDGAPPRYACQDVIFCYASSARQFIEASRRRPRPWAQAPVLIGDSGTTLPDAALELAYLYTAHYAGGRVFGSVRGHLAGQVPGETTARPDDVLDALPDGTSPGASLLHFGCHGGVTVPVLDARLELGTGPDGAMIAVSVRDILRRARTVRPGTAGAGGLAVLAACLTDVTEADYDESLTLAAAFLAAGSSGVVAARWSVPDRTTMLFMAAFHWLLNERGDDPARALRDAQLWMLDPGREIPGGWPEWLKQRAGGQLAAPQAWAAFTYQGR
jgi:CHAT domain